LLIAGSRSDILLPGPSRSLIGSRPHSWALHSLTLLPGTSRPLTLTLRANIARSLLEVLPRLLLLMIMTVVVAGVVVIMLLVLLTRGYTGSWLALEATRLGLCRIDGPCSNDLPHCQINNLLKIVTESHDTLWILLGGLLKFF